MKSDKNTNRLTPTVIWALMIATFGGLASVKAIEPDDLAKQIEKLLSGVQRRIVTEPSRAEKEFIEANKMLAQLKGASPKHVKLATLQKRADSLKTKLEKRLGRPIGGSDKKEETKPKPVPQKPTSSTLPSSVVSRLKRMDAALSAVATALEKNRLQTASTKLKAAQKLMDEIKKRYGKNIPAGNKEMEAAKARLATAVKKYTEAESAATAQAAAQAAKEQQKEAQSQEWIDKFSPFFDTDTGKYLLMGAEFNRGTDQEKK